MEPEEFKQKGLKSGDRVECIIDGEKYIGMVRHTLENQYEWESWKLDTDDGGLRLLFVPRAKRVFPTSIKKLQVTKKKEKKEDMTKKQYNELVDIAGRAIPILNQKPIKSLSNLEIGDEVWCQRCTHMMYGLPFLGETPPLPYIWSEPEQCIVRNTLPRSAKKYLPKGQRFMTCPDCGDTLARPNHSNPIIDEMIEFWESVNSDNDNGWHIPSYNIVSQFITYLKDLKNV